MTCVGIGACVLGDGLRERGRIPDVGMRPLWWLKDLGGGLDGLPATNKSGDSHNAGAEQEERGGFWDWACWDLANC